MDNYKEKKNKKALLLKDLCARLLYKVKGIITYDKSNTTFTVEGIDNNVLHLSDAEECSVEDFKPYLRPMSSMTEEEEHEVQILWNVDFFDKNSWYHCYPRTADFYHSHHFDYRGLIEKGLALEVPEGMYK